MGCDPLRKNKGCEGCLTLDTCIICSMYPRERTAHICTPLMIKYAAIYHIFRTGRVVLILCG